MEGLGRFEGWRRSDGAYVFEPLPEEAPTLGRVRIPAFYTSQWDAPGTVDGIAVDADARRGDCGPAALAPLIYLLTLERPTVDELGDACGQPRSGPGAAYTSHAQLIQGAAAYGVRLESRVESLTLGVIIEELREGRPSISLINYKRLREWTDAVRGTVKNQDRTFNGAHWVLAVGYDPVHPELGEVVEVHDPDFWGDRRGDGAFRAVPVDVFVDVMGTVAETSGATRNFQGLVVRAG